MTVAGASAAGPDDDVPPAWWRRPLRLVLWAALAVFAWFAVSRLVGAIDWHAVADAFGHVPAWVILPLLALLLLRQVLNAVPLQQYVAGLSLFRSLQNDLAAYLVGSFTPPPADVVVRVSMFRAWGVDPAAGLAGVGLNTATFYAVRFGVPVVGVVLLLLGEGVESRQWVTALVCGLVAAACVAALAMLLRSTTLAAWMGRQAGALVGRFRKDVDPQAWADYLVDLRARTSDRLRTGLVPSLLALVAMVLADGSMLLLALRAVGVPMSALTAVDVLAAFLVAYPITLMPMFGFGIMDAVLVGAWTTIAGVAWEPEIVAATIVWRVVTIVGPLVLGLAVVAFWRRRAGDSTDDGATAP
ncbi:lysylphosphatidylglycerol synthase domain-containing protein [Cellulomonas gelida]|uniref:Uncharacterized protein n=1 Tax=Cellulomonas gelida TaxID=1712 RepID=A0A4Y3KK47_9CELL|nr:lysylphosphatidylglycerol synthase domain-containing protein [Cellulomonas gelida]GEA84283.1 hypothetical protein CGE01nite_15340 [Cellulomonas gelida]GGL36446.1 hypothetical protein GCM10009774_28790 [Cellulomonas gelida]